MATRRVDGMNAELLGRLETAIEIMMEGDNAAVKAEFSDSDQIKLLRYEKAIERFRIGMDQADRVLADLAAEDER